MAHKVAAEAPGPREDNGGKFDLQDAVAKLDGEGDNQLGTGDMRMEDLHARGRLENQLACCKVVQADLRSPLKLPPSPVLMYIWNILRWSLWRFVTL